jgi:hypothetical protein
MDAENKNGKKIVDVNNSAFKIYGAEIAQSAQ